MTFKDEDTITAGELHEWAKRSPWAVSSRKNVDDMIQDILDRREVLEDGAVYKDADGVFYLWDETINGFRAFGVRGYALKHLPVRPLVKVS
jgi:hypothetical protein